MFKGVGTALITPFKNNLEVDYEALDRLVKHQLNEGVNMLVVMGTTGESATLNENEKRTILDRVIELNNGHAQVIYGIGGNNTMAVAESLKSFDVDGVDGILSVSPYYNKPTQEGIYQHYKVLNDVSKLPIIVYNVPGRTASNILAETSLRLAELENITSVKEASGSLEQIMQIIKYKPEGFTVLSGDDALTLPILSAGGDGVVSVLTNAYAKEFVDMLGNIDSDQSKANREHYKVFNMIELLFKEGNPAGIKQACKLMGICEGHVRLPLIAASEQLTNEIKSEHHKIR